MAKRVKKNAYRAKRPQRGQGRAGRIAFGILVFLAVLAVAFFIWARSQGELSVTENAVGSLLSPVENAVQSVTAGIRDWMQNISDRNKLKADNEDMQLELMSLMYRVAQLEETEQENERLKTLLDARDTYAALDPVYAKVIARDPGVWFDTFSINQGTLAGIDTNMAVISVSGGEVGLVGRVYEVGLNYAKVMCVIDSRSAVAGMIERTRDNGVMRGQLSSASDDAVCHMNYLPSVNDIVPGDTVITSGTDGVYPKGLPVGQVTAVSKQSDVSDQYIVVSPFVDFQRIEEVLVITTPVETDTDDLPSLPDPTARPRASTTPSASGTLDPNATPSTTISPDEWSYPTFTPGPVGSGVNTPEDRWAATP